jgi:hypothetical protein
MIFLEVIYLFVQLLEYACLQERELISTLKHLSCRKYSFEKLPQFSQGNNVLDAPPSNMDDFLS